jgi:hypothetical protein
VERVDVSTRPERKLWGFALTLGALYRVSDIYSSTQPDDNGAEVFDLVGFVRPHFCGHRIGYRSSRFRPIYRPNAELIEALKAPPVRVSEPA